MIERIKSSITNSYLNFLFDYADPSSVNKEAIVKALGFPIDDLFSSQKRSDHAKRLGKETFNKAVSIYFARFQNSDGVDFKRLKKEITRDKKTMLRHLGKDKLNFLALIISILETEPEVKKLGLLFVQGDAS